MGSTAFMPDLQTLQAAERLQKEVLDQKANGRAMKALALKRRAKVQAFAATREIQPATIINFNPVPIRLNSGLPYSVPSAGRQVEDMLIKVNYGRSKFVGAYLTIRDPHYYSRITDVKLADSTSDLSEGVPDFDCDACRPIESAYHLWASVNSEAADASDMGGVLIMEGDHHRFRKAIAAAAVNPDHPDARIRMPRFITLEDQNRQYFVDDVSVIDVMQDLTTKQMAYFERVMQITQGLFDDPDHRRDITTVDRIWAQYGMTMGWRQSAPVWLNAKEDPTDTCTGCGAVRTRSDAKFCGKCNRPYDAFAAFMSGEDVPQAHLAAYTGDKLKQIRDEMRRRKNALDLDAPDPDDDGPEPSTPAPTPAASQVPAETEPRQPGEVGGKVEKLEDKSKADLLKIANDELGLDLHHNTGEQKIITAIREARAKMLGGVEDEEGDDLTGM